MNEFFVLLSTLATAGWVYLCLVSAVAVGFLFFDNKPKQSAVEHAEPARDRMAA